MARSAAEILFRLRQEIANLWLGFGAASRPELRTAVLPLPSPGSVIEHLRDTPWVSQVTSVAEAALSREFSILGFTIQTEAEIRWRRDYIHHKETGLDYFRRIPYLNAELAGDHKIIWELNRHQHLVAMVQAHLLTGRAEWLEDVWVQLETWLDQNPFCRGINWTSALEVSFRAISWVWIEHLAGKKMPIELRKRWLPALFEHGQFLENNLSFYFSPNTHLQGEALGLHLLGLLFHGDSAAANWRKTGAEVLRQIIHTHVRPDGSHFEQSSYYHVYALDMFLFHAVLERPEEPYRARLRQMAEYLWALSSPGKIPLLGDDDGGRLFHPYGDRRAFARGCLATCAAFLRDAPSHGDPQDLADQAVWWLGPDVYRLRTTAAPSVSKLFPDAQVAVLSGNSLHLVADVRAFGFGSAGHSHAHSLHFTLRHHQQDVLIDPGTYTYVADPAERDLFRGTSFHNTVTVANRSMADPGGPFRWENIPDTAVLAWSMQPWFLHGVCSYRGIRHERRIHWSGGVLFVLDYLTGPDASHEKQLFEQNWHIGGPVTRLSEGQFQLPGDVRLLLPAAGAEIAQGWVSSVPGRKEGTPVIRVPVEVTFPHFMAAAFVMDTPLDDLETLAVAATPNSVTLSAADQTVTFSLVRSNERDPSP